MLTFKQAARLILPPIVTAADSRPKDNQYLGDFRSWNDATAAAGGYDAKNILDKQLSATRNVRDGLAVCERDSVLFDEIEYSFPLLAALLYIASWKHDTLTVVDFGGALGSSYYQNRGMLAHLKRLRWCVVEQPHFVDIGKAEFETEQLGFYRELEECLGREKPDLVLLSSVLQYLESPFRLLADVARSSPPYILIDRTPVLDASAERIVVQHVPPSIYPASYACRLFQKGALEQALQNNYTLRYAFDAHAGTTISLNGATARYRGFFFERPEQTSR